MLSIFLILQFISRNISELCCGPQLGYLGTVWSLQGLLASWGEVGPGHFPLPALRRPCGRTRCTIRPLQVFGPGCWEQELCGSVQRPCSSSRDLSTARLQGSSPRLGVSTYAGAEDPGSPVCFSRRGLSLLWDSALQVHFGLPEFSMRPPKLMEASRLLVPLSEPRSANSQAASGADPRAHLVYFLSQGSLSCTDCCPMLENCSSGYSVLHLSCLRQEDKSRPSTLTDI